LCSDQYSTHHAAIERLLISQAVSRLAPDTEEIVLDFDSSEVLV
jgi:hypothetical protein